MEILTKAEVEQREVEIIQKIRAGAVFIHPTDTIYGLGGNATLDKTVEKIRQLKGRATSPFSIWVPSLKWVRENCFIPKSGEEWLKKLPGPYTLIVKLKNKKAVSSKVAPGVDTVGIRFPQHWFWKIVGKAGVPIITTSANKAGQPFMTRMENLNPEIREGVEFMVYEGEKAVHPSQIVDLEKETVKNR